MPQELQCRPHNFLPYSLGHNNITGIFFPIINPFNWIFEPGYWLKPNSILVRGWCRGRRQSLHRGSDFTMVECFCFQLCIIRILLLLTVNLWQQGKYSSELSSYLGCPLWTLHSWHGTFWHNTIAKDSVGWRCFLHQQIFMAHNWFTYYKVTGRMENYVIQLCWQFFFVIF